MKRTNKFMRKNLSLGQSDTKRIAVSDISKHTKESCSRNYVTVEYLVLKLINIPEQIISINTLKL